MNRRDLFRRTAGMMAGAGLAALPGKAGARGPYDHLEDTRPRGGYNLEPPSLFLFTDRRHINPGELVWRSPGGEVLDLNDPAGAPVAARADLSITPQGVRLEAKPAIREETPSTPPANIIYDDGVYRAWEFRLIAEADPARSTIGIDYLESADGYEWTRQELAPVEAPGAWHGGEHGVFIDKHGPEAERYKAIVSLHVKYSKSRSEALWKRFLELHPYYRDPRMGRENLTVICGVVSRDGREWRMLREPLLVSMGDTPNTITYDPYLGKYVIYSRLYPLRRRMVGRAESDDFRHWTPLRPVVWPSLRESLATDVYTNAYTGYPGMPQQHLMFPMFYDRFDETSEVRMYSSLDGITWDEVPGGAILRPRRDPGSWPGEFLWVSKNLVPLKGDRIGVRFTESSRPHKYPRWQGVTQWRGGYAWWPKGRLSAVVADEEGEFHTFRVQVTGSRLRVNARVRGAGEIRVGLWKQKQDDPDRPAHIAGRTIEECTPIAGDSHEHLACWNGDPILPVDPGGVIGLHFRMRAAELFSFEWV